MIATPGTITFREFMRKPAAEDAPPFPKVRVAFDLAPLLEFPNECQAPSLAALRPKLRPAEDAPAPAKLRAAFDPVLLPEFPNECQAPSLAALRPP